MRARKKRGEGRKEGNRGRKIWSKSVTVRDRRRESEFREILLIKKRSTTRGDGINQSSVLMRHLLIMLE